MVFSIYSFIMGMFWFNILTVLIFILLRTKNFMKFFNIKFLSGCVFCCFIRILLPIDLSFAKVIRSNMLYPFILNKLNNIFNLVLLIVIFISIFLFAYNIIKYVRFKKHILLENSNISDKTKKIYFKVLKDFKIHRVPKLIQNSNIISPFHMGVFNPLIALPNYNFSEEELYYILKHEVIHYYNGDIWIKWLSIFLISLFWWNPFMYMFKKDLEQILEIRCDLKVCEGITEKDKLVYVQTLLNTMKKVSKNRTNCYINSIIKDYTKMSQRFNIILYNIVPTQKNHITNALTSIIIIGLLVSYIFIIQPYHAPKIDHDIDESIVLNSGNSYIKHKDGEYYLYVNDKFFNVVKGDDIKNFKLLGICVEESK